MKDQKNQPKILKALLVGDLQTGKKGLCQRFSTGEYESYKVIYLDVTLKNFKIVIYFIFNIADDFQKEGQEFKLQLWGTTSKERFYESFIYEWCLVLIILYDITCRYHSKNDFYLRSRNNRPILFLVGNKCDLEEERQVSYEEGKQLSESLGMLFMEVSVKENYEVEELFEKMMNKAFNIN